MHCCMSQWAAWVHDCSCRVELSLSAELTDLNWYPRIAMSCLRFHSRPRSMNYTAGCRSGLVSALPSQSDMKHSVGNARVSGAMLPHSMAKPRSYPFCPATNGGVGVPWAISWVSGSGVGSPELSAEFYTFGSKPNLYWQIPRRCSKLQSPLAHHHQQSEVLANRPLGSYSSEAVFSQGNERQYHLLSSFVSEHPSSFELVLQSWSPRAYFPSWQACSPSKLL